MCGHAGTVGTLRPVRRPPSSEGWPGTGCRPGQATGAAGNRTASRSHRRVPDGASGLARTTPVGLRTGIFDHTESRPATRRGNGPDLPDRPSHLGRPVRSAGVGGPGLPTGPAAARRQPELPRLRHARRADLGRHPPRRGRRPVSRRGRHPVRAVQRLTLRRHSRRDGRGPAGVEPHRDRPGLRAVRRGSASAARHGHRAQQRRGGIRGPVPARARVAYVPLPGPAAAPALLPERWPGTAAASFFDRHAARLRPAADRYVEQCLDAGNRIVRQKGR